MSDRPRLDEAMSELIDVHGVESLLNALLCEVVVRNTDREPYMNELERNIRHALESYRDRYEGDE
jgi:hypothetical protein